jgi:hypothetical protein
MTESAVAASGDRVCKLVAEVGIAVLRWPVSVKYSEYLCLAAYVHRSMN